MTYIVLDLEWNATFKKRQFPEIVEIGAVKLSQTEGEVEITDTYHSYVRPTFRTGLSKKTRKMTGITDEAMDQAPLLPDVLNHFLAWIGTGDYYLCTWGDTDRSVLVENCVQHGLGTSWMRNYNDLQIAMMRMANLSRGQQIGLTKALEMMEIPFSGRHHRSIDDALNTARLFQRIYAGITLHQNLCIPREFLFKAADRERSYTISERGGRIYVLLQGRKYAMLSAFYDTNLRQGWIADEDQPFAPETRMPYPSYEEWAHALGRKLNIGVSRLL